MIKNQGGTAFPASISNLGNGKTIVGHFGEEIPAGHVADYPGMTLRDYFAASVDVPKDMGVAWAEALAGRAKPTDNDLHFEWIQFWADAEAAYRGIYADAMLAERAK